jgi:hypothetical protein
VHRVDTIYRLATDLVDQVGREHVLLERRQDGCVEVRKGQGPGIWCTSR